MIRIALACSFLTALVAQEPETIVESTQPEAIEMGAGSHRFAWVAGWGTTADGKDIGNTHGCVVVDAAGHVYANTDTEDAVRIYDRDGHLLRTWGKDWKGGLHGMTLVREGEKEFLYLAHTARHEVAKATLAGEVLWTLGAPAEAGVYDDAAKFKPTSVAVADNGDIYVADGYGQSWIHQFDKDRAYVRSFGGRGKEPGKLQTPHGIWIDRRVEPHVLVVCDRENHRLQLFDLDGKHLRVLDTEVRRPCNVCAYGDDVAVADLCGRVSLFDKEWKVITHLGDNPDQKQWANNGVPRAKWRDGVFIAPHGAAFDADGNLYVLDWVAAGRISKLARR
ncbi:MAG: 6-bladed beta-propeller [Planctomycetota bacterium]